MKSLSLIMAFAAVVAAAPCALGQSASRPADNGLTLRSDSARRAVQRFYDWYLPRSANPRGRDMIMTAATHGPLRFDAELVRWLRIDSTARARAKDEIDGLDGDPYLNAQDPCDAYTTRSARARNSLVLVEIVGHGGCASHTTPDVVVEVVQHAGQWTAVEFRDPHRGNEGLLPLLRRLHPNAR